MKYLITGKNGQLAQTFIKRFEKYSIDYNAFDSSELDITSFPRVNGVIKYYKPDVILNCAAYNFVDKAEKEKDSSFIVNTDGPINLAQISNKYKSTLVHFSSDYIFNGTKEIGLYNEDDIPDPINIYGRSKLLGEEGIIKEGNKWLIFRLSRVFGKGKQNFIYKFLEWAKNNEYLTISCDEFSIPTYTECIVDVTLKSIEQGIFGLYHLTNKEFCSNYEWAKFIATLLNMNKFIKPVNAEYFNTLAKRPKFSAMNNNKILKLLNIEIPTWEEATTSFFKNELKYI